MSLALCAALLVLWVRSYVVRDSVTWSVWRIRSFAVSVQAFSGSGQIGFGYLEARSAAGTGSPLFGAGPRLKWERSRTLPGGFHVSELWAFHAHRSSRASVGQHLCQMPYRFPTALAAGLAAVARRVSRRMRSPELCATCGYDLRATPQRCPECGTEAVAKQ